MSNGKIKSYKEARAFMDQAEVCHEYFKTDKITFGLSELPPGGVGGLDPGHSEADEVFYCMQGHVLCYFPEEDKYYELEKGDALLIPPNHGHKLFNIGEETARIIWSCAPHQ
jgi:mannose-6-phosphate isomerase-like protein (cupin superfamily)